jgi:tetratricopeptide (TPR) repeat protein
MNRVDRESQTSKKAPGVQDDTFSFMGTRISLGSKARKSASTSQVNSDLREGTSPTAVTAENEAASSNTLNGNVTTPTSSKSSLDLDPLARSKHSSQIFLLGAAVLLATVIAFLAWNWFGSTEARIIRAAKSGQLVWPQGSSAYDLYLRLKAEEVSPVTREKLKDEVLPKLTFEGERLLKNLYQSSTLKESELDQLVLLYEWAADLDPQDKAILARRSYAAGRRAVLKGAQTEALSSFRSAIQSDSQWALPFNDLARLYVRAGDYLKAEYYHQQAIQLDPKWTIPRLDLARLHMERNRPAEAEASFRLTAETDPSLPTPWYFLGQLYQRQKRDVEAIAAYERAIELARQRPSSAFAVEDVRSLIEQIKRN